MRILIPFLLILPASSAVDLDCLSVDAPVFTAGDLAVRIEAFRRFPPEQRFGFAPDPGLRRVLSAGELNRFLAVPAKTSMGGDSLGQTRQAVERGICLVRPSRTISAVETEAAIRSAFGTRDVKAEILELSKRAVAASGVLRFSVRDLPSATDTARAVTWNGWFVESDGKKRPVWARVKLKETILQPVAKIDLPVGLRLGPENLGMELRETFPLTPNAVALKGRIEELFGRAPRVPILAGKVVRAEQLTELPTIRKGDVVVLEAITPHARLAVEGTAASTAYRGQRVAIVTALSKKAVQAVASEEGRATIETNGRTSRRVNHMASGKGTP